MQFVLQFIVNTILKFNLYYRITYSNRSIQTKYRFYFIRKSVNEK